MSYFKRFAVFGAVGDLRRYLHGRPLSHVVFIFLAIVITTTVMAVFWVDTPEIEYERKIIYVEQWRADRSDEEIKAQQAKDLPKELARKAEIEARRKKRQEEFKRLDDKLEKWGL